MRKLVLVAGVALALALAACSPREREQPAAADPAQTLTAALDRMVTAVFKELPEFATSLAVSQEIAGGKYSDRLSDLSREGIDRKSKLTRDMRAELGRIDRAKLSSADAVTYDVVAAYLDHVIAGQKFGFGSYGLFSPSPYVVTQIDGAFARIPDFLDSQHQVKSAQDAADYVSRLRAYATMLDQETARIRADAAKGIVPPDFVIDGAVKQLKGFAATAPADTVLVQALKKKVAAAQLEAAKQKELVAGAEAAVKDLVLPAYQRQIAELQAIRPDATHDAGVWRLPNGAEYYAIALRNWNTTDLTPDQIHEMGLRLIEQLDKEMDAILDAQGLTTGTVAVRVQKLSKDPQQLYPNTDEGRAQLLSALNQQIADLQPRMPEYFGQLAQAKLDIRRVPTYIESGAPGGYYQSPALDGSRPGAYYINLRDTAEWPKFTLPTLTYHEGNPGHHWQIAIAQESEGLHMMRSALLVFSGYQEGWGLYAEQLADEMGLYRSDPVGRLGYLQSMAFRAARLVVDTGLHHKKWTREQAIDYMVGVTGDQRSSITTEVERYSVWPGQATAYMVGRETINRLRADAKSRLGDEFDIRAFHDVVLTNGATPLSLLEAVVDSWVSSADQG
ncbi:MAG: DUF885 domain-containing protein [Gammaproteobacteria bacterium]